MNKIVVFGATGMTGLCAIDAALKKGIVVRVFVRDPARLPESLRDKVEIARGDVLDAEAVTKAVDGVAGVVICLGTGNDYSAAHVTFMSEGTRNIVNAMVNKDVKLVSACLSAFLFFDVDKVPKAYKGITDDHRRMYEALRDSPLDYVAVNPPGILDEPSRGDYLVDINPEKTTGSVITKWELGSFLVDSLTEPKYYRQIIGIAHERDVPLNNVYPGDP